MSEQRKTKRKASKTGEKKPAIYYSDKPVSLKEWRAGKTSPNPKPVDSGQ